MASSSVFGRRASAASPRDAANWRDDGIGQATEEVGAAAAEDLEDGAVERALVGLGVGQRHGQRRGLGQVQ